jgi:ATP-dependent RNA helicase RhlB
MGQAQTGTGKTAAYLIALLNRLLTRPVPHRRADQPRALVMAPTRELAIQIYNDAVTLAKHTGLRVLVVYGGMGYETQRDSVKEGTDVIIGTPGRLIDYHKQQLFDLKATEVLVLDEADRMFDLGFIRDVRFLLRRMSPPPQRLNMLFSATISMRVTELAYEHMNNPELVRIDTDRVTADNIHQTVYYVSNAEKIPLLLGVLQTQRPRRTIVFVNTKEAGREIGAYFETNGISAGVLSGDVPQRKRLGLL